MLVFPSCLGQGPQGSQFDDSLGLTGPSIQSYPWLFVTAKGYKAKSAKDKVMWGKV